MTISFGPTKQDIRDALDSGDSYASVTAMCITSVLGHIVGSILKYIIIGMCIAHGMRLYTMWWG